MQDLIVSLAKRLDRIERVIEKMMTMLKSDVRRQNEAEPARVKTEDQECTHNGVKKTLRSSQDLNLSLLNADQMLLPTEPPEALALEQRVDGIYP